MQKVVIWGAGKNCKVVLDALKQDKCNFIGIIDSNKELHQKKYADKWLIDAPENVINKSIDYIIISVCYSKEILHQCKRLDVDDNKIIDYWNTDREYEFIDSNIKKIIELQKCIKRYERQIKNMPYELGVKESPIIRSAEELLEIILKDGKSLSRFGDGDLEIMQKRERLWYQSVDYKLSERLKEVFLSRKRQVIIALADNFGSLECYTEAAADTIRDYLDHGIREELMKVIDMKYTYYDAYVARPYIIYKNKQHAVRIFELFKQIWKNRDVLLVEGSKAYIGVRNDLFFGVKNMHRIIAPSVNAFSSYDEILSLVKKNVIENTLVLISLGPTATVLAYDLAMEGIQALDIGQLDNEYEWYLRGATERIAIPGKCVAELVYGRDVEEIEDIEYKNQVIAKVGNI